MKLPRIRRILAALITMFSLLFAQLAVAAYACPDLAMAAKAAQEAMPGCTDMDIAQPGLCEAHCTNGHQSLDTPANPPIAAFVPSRLVAILPALEILVPATPIQADPSLLARATAPPLAIRHCCFRI